MNFDALTSFVAIMLVGMVPRAMPIISAATGELVDQNAGILNLGVEGLMLIGTIVGFFTDFYTGNVILAFFLAGLSGLLLSMLHAFASVSLKADQVVSGTALWFIGWGVSGVIYRALFRKFLVPPTISPLPHLNIPFLSTVPVIGPIIFGQDAVAYFIIAVLVATHYFLFHTQAGLNLRAVGEDPRTAEEMGVNPKLYRYAAVMFGGFMAGIGGAYLAIAITGTFYYNLTAGIGFIAVALIYFGKWKPFRTLLGCLIYGTVYLLFLTIQTHFQSIPYQFFAMWPYLAILIIIAAVASRSRAPASLAKPYEKGE
ncbi:MAG: ABC transporter permease [Candidatus Bathyarchaeia archaeon]